MTSFIPKDPTKLQMAKIITMALYKMDHEPADDHHKVKQLKTWKKDHLQSPYIQACNILQNFTIGGQRC